MKEFNLTKDEIEMIADWWWFIYDLTLSTNIETQATATIKSINGNEISIRYIEGYVRISILEGSVYKSNGLEYSFHDNKLQVIAERY